ncbi:DUF3304 domain-containing protein [Dyella sp. M7H15-1]|uniref:DUF3304 domain-containing protein n=1 Tax=Dyella sp. M7H15-1 TaxID=2501295 RepID=UPI001F0C0BB2|nr:DUF3304 domain-containing protein [Dyella sp. M7H15-1]
MKNFKKLGLGFMLALLSMMLSSCYTSNDRMGLDVVGYNHTDRDIGWFTVGNGGGGILGKHKGGGGFVCCISIPRKYKPGMTVTVRWGGVERETQERAVQAPPIHPRGRRPFCHSFPAQWRYQSLRHHVLPRAPRLPAQGRRSQDVNACLIR